MSEKQESGATPAAPAGGESPPATDAIAVEAEAEPQVLDDDGDEFPVEVDDDDSEAGIAVEVEPPGTGSAAEAVVAALEAKLVAAEEQRAQLEQEKKDLHDRLLRAAADLENVRRRSRKEVEDSKIDARSKVLKEMLPVVDNLDRAVEHSQQTEDPAKAGAQIIEGVELVLRQFGQALERFDVKPVDAQGQPFDPNVHDAIAQAPATADTPAGTVVSVMQKGYTIGPRLLRPSMVVVATGAAPPAAEPDEPADEPAADPGEQEASSGEAAEVTEPQVADDAAADGPGASETEASSEADTGDDTGAKA